MQLFEHRRNVARIGDQQELAAHAHAQHHANGEGEDVVQRQGANAGGLLVGRQVVHDRLVPGLGLQHVGNQVAMQQYRALGHAGGAAGVLQHRYVIGMQVGFGKGRLAALGHCGVKAHGLRQLIGGHELFARSHHVVDQRALEQAQLVAHGAHHNMLDRRCSQALLQGAGKVFQDEDGFGAGVLELML